MNFKLGVGAVGSIFDKKRPEISTKDRLKKNGYIIGCLMSS